MRCLLGTFSEPSCRLSLGNDQQGRPVIAAVKGVAKRSALRACDRIVSVGGRPITRYEEALAAIRASGDDLQLVLNYRSAGTSAISCLAAIVAKPGLAEHFAHAGADIVLDRTTELPAAITSVLDRAADMNSAPSEAPCHR